jgi:hypothetical protein
VGRTSPLVSGGKVMLPRLCGISVQVSPDTPRKVCNPAGRCGVLISIKLTSNIFPWHFTPLKTTNSRQKALCWITSFDSADS